MFDNIDYENSIEELMMFYGLDVAPWDVQDLFEKGNFAFTFYVDMYKEETKESEKDIVKLYELLKEIEGCGLRIQSNRTKSQTKIKNKEFIKGFEEFVQSWLLERHKYLKSVEEILDLYSRIKSKPANAELGEIAYNIIRDLKPFIIDVYKVDWTKTKLYSLVYDIMRMRKMTGKKVIKEAGKCRDKYVDVENWIRAYEKRKM